MIGILPNGILPSGIILGWKEVSGDKGYCPRCFLGGEGGQEKRSASGSCACAFCNYNGNWKLLPPLHPRCPTVSLYCCQMNTDFFLKAPAAIMLIYLCYQRSFPDFLDEI